MYMFNEGGLRALYVYKVNFGFIVILSHPPFASLSSPPISLSPVLSYSPPSLPSSPPPISLSPVLSYSPPSLPSSPFYSPKGSVCHSLSDTMSEQTCGV